MVRAVALLLSDAHCRATSPSALCLQEGYKEEGEAAAAASPPEPAMPAQPQLQLVGLHTARLRLKTAAISLDGLLDYNTSDKWVEPICCITCCMSCCIPACCMSCCIPVCCVEAPPPPRWAARWTTTPATSGCCWNAYLLRAILHCFIEAARHMCFPHSI